LGLGGFGGFGGFGFGGCGAPALPAPCGPCGVPAPLPAPCGPCGGFGGFGGFGGLPFGGFGGFGAPALDAAPLALGAPALGGEFAGLPFGSQFFGAGLPAPAFGGAGFGNFGLGLGAYNGDFSAFGGLGGLGAFGGYSGLGGLASPFGFGSGLGLGLGAGLFNGASATPFGGIAPLAMPFSDNALAFNGAGILNTFPFGLGAALPSAAGLPAATLPPAAGAAPTLSANFGSALPPNFNIFPPNFAASASPFFGYGGLPITGFNGMSPYACAAPFTGSNIPFRGSITPLAFPAFAGAGLGGGCANGMCNLF